MNHELIGKEVKPTEILPTSNKAVADDIWLICRLLCTGKTKKPRQLMTRDSIIKESKANDNSSYRLFE